MQVDPIHQFEIKDFFPVFHIGGYEISFTNSALYMFIIVGLISLFMIGTTTRRAIVPGRLLDGGDFLRICRQYRAQFGRDRGNEVFSLRLYAVHVHFGR